MNPDEVWWDDNRTHSEQKSWGRCDFFLNLTNDKRFFEMFWNYVWGNQWTKDSPGVRIPTYCQLRNETFISFELFCYQTDKHQQNMTSLVEMINILTQWNECWPRPHLVYTPRQTMCSFIPRHDSTVPIILVCTNVCAACFLHILKRFSLEAVGSLKFRHCRRTQVIKVAPGPQSFHCTLKNGSHNSILSDLTMKHARRLCNWTNSEILTFLKCPNATEATEAVLAHNVLFLNSIPLWS